MSFKTNLNSFHKSITKYGKEAEKLLKIKFNSRPVYGDDDKQIKAKIKLYAGSMITNFQGKKMPKEKAPYNAYQ